MHYLRWKRGSELLKTEDKTQESLVLTAQIWFVLVVARQMLIESVMKETAEQFPSYKLFFFFCSFGAKDIQDCL